MRRNVQLGAVMTGPIGFAFKLFDALLGIAFMIALFVGGLGMFVFGGAPKQYELDALGGAYAGALATLESTARDMREDYCTRAGDAARREGHCEARAG
jgi:hypothetical protein